MICSPIYPEWQSAIHQMICEHAKYEANIINRQLRIDIGHTTLFLIWVRPWVALAQDPDKTLIPSNFNYDLVFIGNTNNYWNKQKIIITVTTATTLVSPSEFNLSSTLLLNATMTLNTGVPARNVLIDTSNKNYITIIQWLINTVRVPATGVSRNEGDRVSG